MWTTRQASSDRGFGARLDQPSSQDVELIKRSIRKEMIMKGFNQTTGLLSIALLLAVFSCISFAQTSTTGTIEGSVVDVNGGAVPGVTVTVTSPNLIRPQSATSNEEGYYRILNLPPGRYVVTVASVKGFSTFEQKDVDVNLSKTSNVTVTLQL